MNKPAAIALLLAVVCAGRIMPSAGAAEQRRSANERSANERYFDRTVVPGVDRLQEDALAAVRAADPERLGNALLMLILARDSLASALDKPALPEERASFLRNIAIALGLAGSDDFRRFRRFLDWAGKQDWMPKIHDALLRFERHIADADPLGAWIPKWIDSIPLLPEAAFEKAIPSGAHSALPPAWTWRGHAAAQELAAAANAKPGWRASVLAEYRRNALAAWKGAAETLWDSVPGAVPDAEIPVLLRRAAEGDDPASRFAALAAEHLLPMFDAEDEAVDAPPEITWLRHRLQLEPPETPIPAASDGEAIDEAARRATERTTTLNAAAGANVWPTLSPLATDVYIRHLLARRAALELDAAWQRTVYTPARFSPGGEAEERERLVAFLTGPAHGFWIWRENAGGAGEAAIDNARWHGVPFSLSREFLDYCNAALAAARSPALAEIPLTLSVDSVTVTGDNVIERPTATRFRLGAERDGQTLSHRNYPVAADWIWTPEINEAEIRLVFPSHTAVMSFAGPAELRKFSALFGEGSCYLSPDSFGPDSAAVLRRLGIADIIINATLTNLPKLLARLNRPALPSLPGSIISKGRGQK